MVAVRPGTGFDVPRATRSDTAGRSQIHGSGWLFEGRYGPGVVACPGRVDLPGMVVGPLDEMADRLEERVAGGRQVVVDSRRHDRVDLPGHDPIALQAPEGHREHPLAYPVDRAQQVGEPARAIAEQADHVHRPLVTDTIEDVPRATRRDSRGFRAARDRLHHGSPPPHRRTSMCALADIPSVTDHGVTYKRELTEPV